MRDIEINIGRLVVALHGVSAAVVEEAAAGLEAELSRRLGTIPWGDMAAFDVGDLSVGPLRADSVLDAAALRGIIADRLVQALVAAHSEAVNTQGGTV